MYEDLLPELEAEEKGRIILTGITMETIVDSIAHAYKTTDEKLTSVVKGPQKSNESRKIAMYLCQQLADVKLKDIAKYFNLGHIGLVSFITHQIRRRKQEDKEFSREISKLIQGIMKKAT